MTIFHLQTEDVLFMAQQVKSLTENSVAQTSQLNGLIQRMDWDGPSCEEFRMEATRILNSLENHIQLGEAQAVRLEHEVREWEELSATLSGYSQQSDVVSGGGTNWPILTLIPMGPIFGVLYLSPRFDDLPKWLHVLYKKIFPDNTLPSLIDEKNNSVEPNTPLGELNEESLGPEVTSPPVENQPTTFPDTYEIYHEVHPKSQENVYGRAACLPTAVSMVTDYHHAMDASNKAVTRDEFIGMLDKGDGTSGTGVGLDKLNDELNEAGYTEVKNSQSDMTGLKDELQRGPVVVNVKANLTSIPERTLKEGNGYNHALVVKGISADKVLVNDPWTGKEIGLPYDQFERMWKNGESWMQTIQP